MLVIASGYNEANDVPVGDSSYDNGDNWIPGWY